MHLVVDAAFQAGTRQGRYQLIFWVFGPNRYCCSASSYDSVAIPCDGYEMLVYVVTSCGCFECAEPNLVYAGVARGIDGTAMRYSFAVITVICNIRVICSLISDT